MPMADRSSRRLHRMVALDDRLPLNRNAAFLQLVLERDQPRLRRVQTRRAGNECNLSVAKGSQVLNSLADALRIIHAQDADSRPIRRYIDEILVIDMAQRLAHDIDRSDAGHVIVNVRQKAGGSCIGDRIDGVLQIERSFVERLLAS